MLSFLVPVVIHSGLCSSHPTLEEEKIACGPFALAEAEIRSGLSDYRFANCVKQVDSVCRESTARCSLALALAITEHVTAMHSGHDISKIVRRSHSLHSQATLR